MSARTVNGARFPFVASTPWRERVAAAAVEKFLFIVGYLPPDGVALSELAKVLGIDNPKMRHFAALEVDFVCRQILARSASEAGAPLGQENVDDI